MFFSNAAFCFVARKQSSARGAPKATTQNNCRGGTARTTAEPGGIGNRTCIRGGGACEGAGATGGGGTDGGGGINGANGAGGRDGDAGAASGGGIGGGALGSGASWRRSHLSRAEGPLANGRTVT